MLLSSGVSSEMWGGNGKNHTWPMGHYWLVALFVLPATLAHAAFDQNDKNNLYHIYEHVNSIDILSMELWDWLDDRENAIDTSLSDIHNIRNWLFGNYVYHGDPLAYIVADSRSVLEDIRAFLEPFTNSVVSSTSPFDSLRTAQIAVTNIAETYWLEKIYDALKIGGAGYTVYSPYVYTKEDNTLYSKAIKQLMDGISSWEAGDIDDATFFNRYGSWLEHVHDFASHIDYGLLPQDEHAVYLNVLTRFAPSMGPGPRRRFRDTYDGISHLYQMQYGTYVLQNMATNTFLSGVDVNNFFTNGVALSLYATNTIQHIADSSRVNTNEMYLGSYGSETNSDVFADIITNGVELLDGNQVYSSLGHDVDAGSLSNKVSMFDFTEKFDDSIKPFLDEIENASGGDWVINFGSVDLGTHFSFTIPSLTVERNETYLRYVDKFLDLLKIILGVVFFLILWRQLEQAVEST